ncbi:MAG: cytochrome c [Beijerinckiaceae bacterium]
MTKINRYCFRRALVVLVAAGIIGTGAINLTSAHQGAKGVVKQRMDLMKDISKDLKSVLQMVNGQKAFDGKSVAAAALAIANHAGQIPKLFPKGSSGHPSEATPDVWKDWNGFVKQADDMKAAAAALAASARTASKTADIVPAFKSVAETCSSCHSKFRMKKQ